MNDDEQRLLEQIRANPGDDQLRLVYADVLLARGDERGEYTALAVATDRPNPSVTTEQNQRKLVLARREAAWASELGCEGFRVVVWRRGLPDFLSGDAQTFAAHRDVLRRLPITRISISEPRDFAQLAGLSELSFIEDIWLHASFHVARGVHEPIPRHELAALCASPNTRALRFLKFEQNALADDNTDVLGAACWLRQLEALWIGYLSGEGLARVLPDSLPRLRELALWEGKLGERGAQAFAACELPVLEHLRLHNTRLGETGTTLLLGSANLATVQRLELAHDNARTAAAALEHARALRELTLYSDCLTDDDAVALATNAALSTLVKLGLVSNTIGDRGAAALAGSTNLPALATLDLAQNQLTRDGGLALANRTGLPALTHLVLSGNPFPSGETREIDWYDQGFIIGGHTESIPIAIEEIRTWFAHRPEVRIS